MEGKRKKDDNTKNTLFTYFSKKSRNNKLNKESCDDVSCKYYITMINLYLVFITPIFIYFIHFKGSTKSK